MSTKKNLTPKLQAEHKLLFLKYLKKAVYAQLEAYLVENNIIYDYQSGFRSSFSTDTCLIHLLDHIKRNSARGLFTGTILLDPQKAFGSTKWFESYLSNRS